MTLRTNPMGPPNFRRNPPRSWKLNSPTESGLKITEALPLPAVAADEGGEVGESEGFQAIPPEPEEEGG